MTAVALRQSRQIFMQTVRRVGAALPPPAGRFVQSVQITGLRAVILVELHAHRHIQQVANGRAFIGRSLELRNIGRHQRVRIQPALVDDDSGQRPENGFRNGHEQMPVLGLHAVEVPLRHDLPVFHDQKGVGVRRRGQYIWAMFMRAFVAVMGVNEERSHRGRGARNPAGQSGPGRGRWRRWERCGWCAGRTNGYRDPSTSSLR